MKISFLLKPWSIASNASRLFSQPAASIYQHSKGYLHSQPRRKLLCEIPTGGSQGKLQTVASLAQGKAPAHERASGSLMCPLTNQTSFSVPQGYLRATGPRNTGSYGTLLVQSTFSWNEPPSKPFPSFSFFIAIKWQQSHQTSHNLPTQLCKCANALFTWRPRVFADNCLYTRKFLAVAIIHKGHGSFRKIISFNITRYYRYGMPFSLIQKKNWSCI